MNIVREIVHVKETQEQIDGDDELVVDYREIRTVNGNGSNGHD
jgi:hypothetical protein